MNSDDAMIQKIMEDEDAFMSDVLERLSITSCLKKMLVDAE
jgi:hypothetical protein